MIFPKYIIGILFFGLLASMPQPASAAVAFNTFPISFTRQTDRDLPMIDARNVSAGGDFSTSQTDHDNGVQASPGDVIEFQIYYHNSGVAEDVAHNVIIRATLPGGVRQSHEVSATIDSDETTPISSSNAFFGGNITVHISGQAQTLDFVSGSVRHFPNRSAVAQIPSNGDNLVSSGINIGSIQGCFEFSGLVTFRARVGSGITTFTEERNLSINKRVLNFTRGETTFRDSTSANPGDRLRFEIQFSTTGTAAQTNVIARDVLSSSQLNFVSGSLRIDGVSVANEPEFFGSGRNFGTLSAGTSRTLTFEATVAGAGAFSGSTTVINTANVRSDQVSTRQDDAPVLVQLAAGVSFQQRKTAFNLTQGVDAATRPSNPGDVIVYALNFKNTGATTMTGVVIEDNIQDVLELAQITNQGGAASVNSVIRYPSVDIPSGVEISRTFEVKIKDASLFPQTSDLVMVNVYGNETRVQVRRPQVGAAFQAAVPPRTGAGEWLAVSLALLVTTGYWLKRKFAV